MSATYDYGPLCPYQVIWRSGHVETIWAHQVLLPSLPLFGDPGPRSERLTIHGEVEGRWMLLLDADYSEIASVRLITSTEVPS